MRHHFGDAGYVSRQRPLVLNSPLCGSLRCYAKMTMIWRMANEETVFDWSPPPHFPVHHIYPIEKASRVCIASYKHERGWENSRQFMQTQDEVEGLHNTPRVSISAYANTGKSVSLYRYWWNTRIFPFTKKSYLHRAQWRYYFYLSGVRILVSSWLLTWLANYKRTSRSGY